MDLISGEEKSVSINEWISELSFPVINHLESKRFIHFFYECGFLFENLENLISDEDILAIDITYSETIDHFTLQDNVYPIKLQKLKYPSFSDYEKKFKQGYAELTKGNCYQFNLTEDFLYKFENQIGPHDFISKIWKDSSKRGAYASATYIGKLGKLFFSNSPECLFQYGKGELISRPVKGTLKRKTNKLSEIKTLWRELIKDQKSQAELYMITDLLRNDLARIDLPRAFVTKLKAPLLAPGILHQYSEIKVPLRSHVTLKEILKNIFPGGSITGAPKKKAMALLNNLEKRKREFYCGSTLMLMPGGAVASINIRSSVIDFHKKTLSYQAGGGITLLSEAQSEFEELLIKHDSFLTLLTL